MEKENFKEQFINEILKDIENSRQKSSTVSRNKNKKTITVSNAFDENRIPIKVIAPYEKWLQWEDSFISNSQVTFKDIEHSLSKENLDKNKIVKIALKEYCERSPDDFMDHFYYFYVLESNAKNPLLHKTRKSKTHKKDPFEMTKIRITASHLYVFLAHWLKRKQSEYPDKVKEFFEANPITIKLAIPATMEILKPRFNSDKIQDYNNFYDKYIVYRKLDNLKRIYQKLNFLPITKPLKSFL